MPCAFRALSWPRSPVTAAVSQRFPPLGNRRGEVCTVRKEQLENIRENPGERGAVLSIPFGSGVPRQGRVEVKLGSKTTSERTWYAEASEADIVANKEIQFTPDTPPWPAGQLKLVSDEPQFEVAKQMLESILTHPDPETRGLSS